MARRAKSLAELLEEVDVAAPRRNKSQDGWIGDEKHQARTSDHNANAKGVVLAQDLTHDPAGGFDAARFTEALRKAEDHRLGYVIFRRKIFGGPTSGTYGKDPWHWKPYGGQNPHDLHCHVSASHDETLYDDPADWDFEGAMLGISMPGAAIKTLPVLRKGDKGFYVQLLQTRLGGTIVDGEFGPLTEQAVFQFQRDHKLEDDGVVGAYTWRELLRPWARETGMLPADPRGKLQEMAQVAIKAGATATPEALIAAYLVILADIIPPDFEWQQPPPPVTPPVPAEPPPVTDDSNKTFHAVTEGGFYSANPFDKKVNTSIRCNNPGALNTTPHIASLPGYYGASETSPGNKTAIFYAPEYGCLAYWDLLERYRAAGAKTIHQIIDRYGGGQNYAEYESFVTKTTGLPSSYEIKIDGSDDTNLRNFAKAMFRYEAGVNTPLSDKQIDVGFKMARERRRMA